MASHLRFLSLLLLSLVLGGHSLIYDQVTDLPQLRSYDYVVVGGGAGGGVIANRLSEDRRVNVLVLEAGPTNRGRPELEIPYLIRQALAEPALDWNTTYIPQPGLNGRTVAYNRGYVLGGSTSINGMVYSRGTADDWNRYAKITGDQGWSWNSILPYFKKNELFTPYVNTTGRYDPKDHTSKGITGTSVNTYPMDTDSIMMQVTKDASSEFPFTQDYNSGVAHGVGWAQYTIKNGSRSSSAWAYLGDEFIARPNLHVLVGAKVSRVLQSAPRGAVNKVEFTHGGNATTLYINVSREIILSSGAAGSPHILLNSGVGDAKTLASMNIPVIANLPSVGQNLSDQTLVPFTRWITTSTDNFQHVLDNATTAAAALDEWTKSRTGPYGAGGINQFVWLRMNDSDPEVKKMLKKYGDPAAGPLTPHFEITPSNGRPQSGPLLDVSPIALNPYSRGSLTLDPKNPLGPPILDGKFYSHPMDMFIQKKAILAAIRMVQLPAFSKYIVGPSPEFAPVFAADGSVDDQALETFIRNNTLPNIHAVATNSMSPANAPWGVVDPHLRVKGLKGLRVVDASVLPFGAAGHSMAPVYALSERAADLIKQDNHF